MKVFASLMAAIAISASALAGDAVSGLNGKVDYFAGDMDGNTGNNFEGSISLPLGKQFGFQADALYTDVSDRDFYGLGTHLFWRNPEKGLLGVACGAVRENDLLDSRAGGVEGEYYLGKFTFGTQLGVANIDYQVGPLPFIETDETSYYASGSIGFYPMDELLLSLTYTHSMDNGVGQAQIEHQTLYPGLCIFGDVAIGDYDYHHAMVGIRYYFGKKKTLILRHREDDPPSYLNAMLYTIGSYGAEFNQRTDTYVAERPSSSGGSSGSYGSVVTISTGGNRIPLIGGILESGSYTGTIPVGGNGSWVLAP